jgi:hypothetical protein
MLSGFGPDPLLQAGGAWHSPPEPLQLAVVIVALPDQYTLNLICGGGVGVLSGSVKATGALASKSATVTMLVTDHVFGMR